MLVDDISKIVGFRQPSRIDDPMTGILQDAKATGIRPYKSAWGDGESAAESKARRLDRNCRISVIGGHFSAEKVELKPLLVPSARARIRRRIASWPLNTLAAADAMRTCSRCVESFPLNLLLGAATGRAIAGRGCGPDGHIGLGCRISGGLHAQLVALAGLGPLGAAADSTLLGSVEKSRWGATPGVPDSAQQM